MQSLLLVTIASGIRRSVLRIAFIEIAVQRTIIKPIEVPVLHFSFCCWMMFYQLTLIEGFPGGPYRAMFPQWVVACGYPLAVLLENRRRHQIVIFECWPLYGRYGIVEGYVGVLRVVALVMIF